MRQPNTLLKVSLLSVLLAPITQLRAQTNAIVVSGYADIIKYDKPIAYYRFEETSGSVAKNDGSKGGDGQYSVGDEASPGAGGSPGAASGAPGPRPPAFKGFATNNHSATFDGGTLWVDTKNQFLQHASAFTLEYWVSPGNRVSDPSTFGSRIGIVGQNDAVEYGFIDANTIQIWTPNGGSLNTSYSFPDGEWHHVATIADGQTIKTYYDGNLVGTGGSATADYGNSAYFVHIGGGGVYDATGNWFTGNIDEVAIFDRAIPAARVAQHFQAGKSGNLVVPFINEPTVNLFGFAFDVNDVGPHVADTNSLSVTLNGTKITPTAVTKTNGTTTVTYKVPNPLPSAANNNLVVTIKDTGGVLYSNNTSFTSLTYATLDAAQRVTPDTSKPGFIWEMSQVDSVGSYTQNSIARTIAQLNGLVGPNTADPSAQGVAQAPGKPNSDPNLPIVFEIPTIINLSAAGNTGDFPPGDQMPGSPGTGGGTDNQAGRATTYVDLPAGVITMGVNSDDNFRTIAGIPNDVFSNPQLLGQFDSGGRGIADTVFTFVVPQAGVYPLYTLWENGGGSSDLTWFTVKAYGTKVLLNDTANGGFKAYRAVVGGAKAAARTVVPPPNGVADPTAPIMVELVDASNPIDKSTVSLKLDNNTVGASITKTGSVTTLTYLPTPKLVAQSVHTATIAYTEVGASVTHTWQFTVAKGKILFVMNDASAPINADPNLIAFFQAKLYYVTTFTANNSTPDGLRAAAAGQDLVFISESIGSTTVLDPAGSATGVFSLKDTNVPVISYEAYMWDNADWVNRTSDGSNDFTQWGNSGRTEAAVVGLDDARDSLYIVATNSPITAGLPTGKVQVYKQPYSFNYGKPSADADIIAVLQPDGSWPTEFVYKKGAKLQDGTVAPNLRIGLFLGQAANPNANTPPDFNNLTDAGKQLLLNTVAYAIPSTAPAVPTLSFTKSATGLTLTFTGSLQQAAAITGPWNTLTVPSPYVVTNLTGASFFRAKQ